MHAQTGHRFLRRFRELSLLRFNSVAWCIFGLAFWPLIPSLQAADFNVFTFLTNCPPIEHLVLEVQHHPERRRALFKFRYQQAAFYAEKLSDSAPGYYSEAVTGTSAGFWGDEYWYLTTKKAGMLPIITSGSAAGKDRELLERQNQLFDTVFSYFASFGISPAGVNSVKVEKEQLTFLLPGYNTTCTGSMVLSNGLLSEANVTIRHPNASYPLKISYLYDSTLPTPIPREIIGSMSVPVPPAGAKKEMPVDENTPRQLITVLRYVVKEFRFGNPDAPLRREMFFPDSGRLPANTLRVVVTNGQNYEIRNGTMISMAVPQEILDKQLREGGTGVKGRSFFAIGFFLVAIITLVVILVAQKQKEQNT